jgi:biofilm PGA synthesis lipoprotein PgaB
MGNMIRHIILLVLILFIPTVQAAAPLTAICYHDVKKMDQGDLDIDQYAISPEHLLAQFEYIKANNFIPVSIDDLIKAQNGDKPLPEKALLLTFDDGYISFYSEVYPLLRLYNYPAVLAVVGRWLEIAENEPVTYGNKQLDRDEFLSWRQIKEMHSSGLVEVASHSYDMHRGIIGNPSGNTQPAAVTRFYDQQTNQYESDEAYLKRIKQDLRTSSSLIEKHLGIKPRVMVWPYGAYSRETKAIAADLGMEINFTLVEDKATNLNDLTEVHRTIISANPTPAHFAYLLNKGVENDPTRVMHIDLDYVFDNNQQQLEQNLDQLVERVYQMDINTVYLQAFADDDGDGNVDALYFPNRHLPVRSDLFNRVAWQLRTRTGVDVYAWMPVMAFDFGEEIFSELGVKEFKDGNIRTTEAAYRRLSPFNEKARIIINEIYADLGKYSKFQGLLFHDDAYFTDFEDFSDDAMDWYASHHIDASPEDILNNPELGYQLSEIKTDFLIDFTLELAETVRQYQPTILTARNMYARPVINPESELWFAHDLEKFISAYDMTAIMAMPYMEKAEDPALWLAQLLELVSEREASLKEISGSAELGDVLFELQSLNWDKGEYINSDILHSQISYLLENGVNNIGYYPDDFLQNQPDISKIKSIFSLQTFPYKRK